MNHHNDDDGYRDNGEMTALYAVCNDTLFQGCVNEAAAKGVLRLQDEMLAAHVPIRTVRRILVDLLELMDDHGFLIVPPAPPRPSIISAEWSNDMPIGITQSLREAARLINEQTGLGRPRVLGPARLIYNGVEFDADGVEITTVTERVDYNKSIPVAAIAAFAVGEPVRLKTGGPVMYIEEIEESKVRCRWTKASGLIERGVFDPEELEPAEDGR